MRLNLLKSIYYGYKLMKTKNLLSMEKIMFVVWLIPLWHFISVDLLAHGQLHPQIVTVSKQLKSAPNDVDLLLRRSVLWYEHGEFSMAIYDAKQVLQQQPNSGDVLLLLGRLKRDQHDYVSATPFANRFVALFPKQAQGYLLRASILRNIATEETNAISDYSTAINLLKHPRPELFLQRADIQQRQKEKGVERALQQLAEARERNGFLYVLQKRAFDIANKAKRFAAAITIAIDITEHVQRKEQWLKIQGELQHTMGNDEKAQKLYGAAQTALTHLPQRLQRHADMISLKQELSVLLKKTTN